MVSVAARVIFHLSLLPFVPLCLGKVSGDELCWPFPLQDGKVKCESFIRYPVSRRCWKKGSTRAVTSKFGYTLDNYNVYNIYSTLPGVEYYDDFANGIFFFLLPYKSARQIYTISKDTLSVNVAI